MPHAERHKVNTQISAMVGTTIKRRLIDYAHKHKMPYSRVVRRILEAVPFDDDTVTPVVLKIPKHIAADKVQLREWLSEAIDEIEQLLGRN